MTGTWSLYLDQESYSPTSTDISFSNRLLETKQ